MNLPSAFGIRFRVISIPVSFFHKLVETSFILLISSSLSRLKLEAENKRSRKNQEAAWKGRKTNGMCSKQEKWFWKAEGLSLAFLFFFFFCLAWFFSPRRLWIPTWGFISLAHLLFWPPALLLPFCSRLTFADTDFAVAQDEAPPLRLS